MIDKTAEKVLFSWIHLSDIHFLHGNQTYQVDQEMILQALINEVETAMSTPSSSLPKPDAIFITGDVAFSGGEKDINEYTNAEQWLNKLKDALRLSPYDIFIVPGNHDIQRSIYIDDDDVSLLLESLRENRRNLEWALNDEKQRNRLSSRLENFIEFSSKFRNDFRDKDKNNEKLFWQGNLSVGTKFGVRLIGLNTALLSQDDVDKGNLKLSLHQLKEVPDLTDGSNELCIALSHHPLSWLADGETVEGWLRKKAHIHLTLIALAPRM